MQLIGSGHELQLRPRLSAEARHHDDGRCGRFPGASEDFHKRT